MCHSSLLAAYATQLRINEEQVRWSLLFVNPFSQRTRTLSFGESACTLRERKYVALLKRYVGLATYCETTFPAGPPPQNSCVFLLQNIFAAERRRSSGYVPHIHASGPECAAQVGPSRVKPSQILGTKDPPNVVTSFQTTGRAVLGRCSFGSYTRMGHLRWPPAHIRATSNV